MSSNKGKRNKKVVEVDSEEEDDPSIFPMKELIARRPKIVEKIFEMLDNKSLTECREVSTFWRKFIDFPLGANFAECSILEWSPCRVGLTSI